MIEVQPLQTVAELLARARSQIGLPITYKMGGGASHAIDEACSDRRGECDCSAFVCWTLKLNKYGRYPWLTHEEHGSADSAYAWYGTANIYRDAHALEDGLFDEIKEPEPGCLILFPEYKKDGKRIPGHVGIVTKTLDETVPPWAPPLIVHCSSGNQNRFGYAIAQTTDTPFRGRPNLIYAWCRLVARPT